MCCCPPFCWCFPGTAKVLTTRGYVQISDLKSTDKLLSISKNGKIKETCLYSFLHFDPKITAEFITLNCGNENQLTLTGDHLVFRLLENGKSEAVAAKNIKIGDCLIHLNEHQQISYPSVSDISNSVIEGIYSPLSKTGTLIVDGFKTSCYAHVSSQEIAHTSLAPLRLYYKTTSKMDQLIYKKKDQYESQNDSKFPKGIHQYAKFLIAIRSSFSIRGKPILG